GLSEGVGAEEVQHLEGGEALGRRRRLVNGDAAIGRGHRLAPARALLAEILLGEEAAVGARVARHLARRLALVEAGAAESADALERAREVRVAQTLPESRRLPAGEENGRRLGAFREGTQRLAQPSGTARRHLETVPRAGHRGLEVAGQREPAERGMRLGPAAHGAGRGESRGDDAAAGDLVEAAVAKPLEGARRGGTAARGQEAHGAAAGGPEQPETVAAQGRHVRVNARKYA